METVSITEQTLSRVFATEEVTNDIVVARHITMLTRKIFARSRAFKEVLDTINMSQRLTGCRKQQDFLVPCGSSDVV